MIRRQPCDHCRGEGMVIVSEWNDQYDRTHASYDACPECGGTGEVEVEARVTPPYRVQEVDDGG